MKKIAWNNSSTGFLCLLSDASVHSWLSPLKFSCDDFGTYYIYFGTYYLILQTPEIKGFCYKVYDYMHSLKNY